MSFPLVLTSSKYKTNCVTPLLRTIKCISITLKLKSECCSIVNQVLYDVAPSFRFSPISCHVSPCFLRSTHTEELEVPMLSLTSAPLYLDIPSIWISLYHIIHWEISQFKHYLLWNTLWLMAYHYLNFKSKEN